MSVEIAIASTIELFVEYEKKNVNKMEMKIKMRWKCE